MARLRFVPWVAIAACAFSVGCVPQDRYDQLLTANRSLEEQLVSVEDERDEARISVSSLQNQLSQIRGDYALLDSQYTGLQGEVENLDASNDDYLRRMRELELGPLPPEIASALEDVAFAHPDLVSFDKQRGMLRFASDFTFALGSAELTDTARQTIQSIAAVLSSDSAVNLEARIVGHTDNVRIAKPATRAQHPTNWHLSVHRSISVCKALVSAGVNAQRIQVAGYGEYRPIVANGTKGAADNRRVEIFLTANSKAAALGIPSRRAPEIGTAPGRTSIDPNK